MRTINRIQPTLPSPVSDRRASSGAIVRFLYAAGLLSFVGYMAYYFGQSLIFFEGPGVVRADWSTISLPFTVKIKAMHASPGMKVDKGEEIASVYSPDVNSEISRLLTSIATISQRREELKVKMDVAESSLELARLRSKTAKNAERKVVAAPPEALNATFRLDVMREAATATQALSQLAEDKERAQAEIGLLTKIQKGLEKQLEIARLEYNDGKVISPMAGVVGLRTARTGETLTAGQPIAEVYDETRTYIGWFMPYTKWRRPKLRDQVYVLFGNNYLRGYVWEISPVTDVLENKRTSVLREPEQGQLVKVKLKEDSEILPVGAQVSVRMLYSNYLDNLYEAVSRFLASNYVHY